MPLDKLSTATLFFGGGGRLFKVEEILQRAFQRCRNALAPFDRRGIDAALHQADKLDGVVYEDYTGIGLLSGASIDRGYDSQHRLRYLATEAGYGATYLFDTAGRLNQIAETHHRADIGYESATEILDSVTIRRVGTPRLRHERSIDKLGRVEWVKTSVDGATSVRRDYTHNAANQRTIAEHEDGRAWHYGYYGLGQVNSAHKRLSDDPQSPVLPGYTFGYAFDDIGNRETATRNARTATYTPDSTLLNQYEERAVPGFVNVLGEAHTTATVTVDGQATQRTGGDFHREVTVDNAADPVHSEIDVEAEIDNDTVDETRWAFLSEDPEVFVHDLDGNLTSDGRWDYSWDAENRLRAMETRSDVAIAFPALKERLEFVYDHQGRRIRKVVKEWDPGSNDWELVTDLRFIYDGWNLIEERDALEGDAVIRKHVWGPDMSGSRQGVGGVGGLLWSQTETQTFAASADANGNVVAWINTATLAVAGRTDYSPFGEPVVQTGVANDLPFGFSSKYEDAETDLLYYGYRYYSPSMGRFLNRDPMEEQGGLNLYAFVGNDPVNKVDHLGLYSINFTKYRAPLWDGWGRGWDNTPWDINERLWVNWAQDDAISYGFDLIGWLGEYISEIPEIYCPSRGRNTLESEVRYITGATGGSVAIMQSSKALYVSKNLWGGGAAFVPKDGGRDDQMWVTPDFFSASPRRRAATFFHEVTHLTGFAPVDASDIGSVDGWHKVGNLYEFLTVSGGIGRQ